MSEYTGKFHPAIVATTGDSVQLTTLTKSLGLRYSVDAGVQETLEAKVGHSATLSIIGPAGRLRGRSWVGFDVDGFVAEFVGVVKGYRP